MKDYAFEIEMKVRDYECDLQGVVNNSNYQHYMEHARHEFLETTGTSFSALHDQGIDVMVSRIDISYKHSLRGSDRLCRPSRLPERRHQASVLRGHLQAPRKHSMRQRKNRGHLPAKR